jgi:hypothetical protein
MFLYEVTWAVKRAALHADEKLVSLSLSLPLSLSLSLCNCLFSDFHDRFGFLLTQDCSTERAVIKL